MNIGLVSQALPYLPSRGGFRLYGANLIRCLSRRHQIDLISLLRDDDEQHLDWPRQYCATVSTIPSPNRALPLRIAHFAYLNVSGTPLRHRGRLRALLRQLAPRRQWDVLHIEGGYVGSIVPDALLIPKVLSLHDSWTLRCREMLKCNLRLRERLYYTWLQYREPRFERMVYPRFERCVVVASRDAEEVRKTVLNANITVIPYGTDTEYFHPVAVEKQEATLVFHGHLGYAPNIEAALEFANDIFPLITRGVPNLTFHLVGAEPAPSIQALATRPGIKLSPNLPDIRPAVCSARIYVCPIRHGTGLKSKVLEAMAMRMPIVCYPGSTVGLDCVPGQHLSVAQDPQEFASQVLDLLRQPERANQLAQAAREFVEQHYSWESRACAYEELYKQIIAERKLRATGNRQEQGGIQDKGGIPGMK